MVPVSTLEKWNRARDRYDGRWGGYEGKREPNPKLIKNDENKFKVYLTQCPRDSENYVIKVYKIISDYNYKLVRVFNFHSDFHRSQRAFIDLGGADLLGL